MSAADNESLMRTIADLLASGLKTKVEPFPATEREFGAIVDELRAIDPKDIASKLVIAGFLDRPYGPERLRCMECISYLVNRKWCDLPELAVPAEPDWYCKLWRI
jgi:hypothetical protein